MEARPAAGQRGPHTSTLGRLSAQLVVGVAALALAATAGLVFVHRPWPNRLDVWGYAALPAEAGARWATISSRWDR
jgi:hypothetical protein